MKYQQILDENGNVLTENGIVPNFSDFNISEIQTTIDSINNIRKNHEKLSNEFDFKELDLYKNNAMLKLFQLLLGNKYNDGFGVYLYENWQFPFALENANEELRVEKNDESVIIYFGTEKLFEKKAVKFTEHNINDKTINVSYNVFDTYYVDGIAYNFFDNKMTFDGNEMLFDNNGLCIEGTFVMESDEGLKTKKVVRDENDLSLVHIDYFMDGQPYESEDKYLATLEKINSEAIYNEKCDTETYMRRIEKNLVAFPALKDKISENYLLQNSKSL